MSKNITAKEAPNGKRTILADVLPLDTPFIVQIFDIYACNLACRFCHYGLPMDKRPKLTEKTIMDYRLFCKIIDDMKGFPRKIKMLRFCGAGESLLDPEIVRMIDYAGKSGVAEQIELITNGTLLTHEMTDAILSTNGLSRIRFSIYGLDSDTYRETCQRNIDFDEVLDNIRYFHDERVRRGSKVRVYLKTMDCCLKNEQDKERFVSLFSAYCDVYAIEEVIPNVTGIDYSKWLEGQKTRNALGFELPDIKVCPQPYHLVTIRPDGKVVPCQKEFMDPVGDCNTENFVDIWNGRAIKEFQYRMLDGSMAMGGHCAECEVVHWRPFPEDILDGAVDKLKKIYDATDGKRADGNTQ